MAQSQTSVVLRQPSGSLPAEVDSFVGRRSELAEIRRLFTLSPLVTVAGPGGVGKTRLALHAAAQLNRTFRDGVCFVSLSTLQDDALLIQAITQVLGLRESSMLDRDTAVELLREKKLLLVLDNCEHVLDEVALFADALLRNCPGLRILATSRETLGIRGEATLRVPPLTVPDPLDDDSVRALPQIDSVALFMDRARTADPEFQVTEQNSRDIARICRQLDGVPLALELAAARLRTVSPHELACKLEDKYDVLVGGSRAAPVRHQTLRLCVDWSYEQCSPEEKVLWGRLTVFSGDFELDAVEEICGFGELPPARIFDTLTGLVDKSIVTRALDSAGKTARFKILTILREYGWERTAKSDESEVLLERYLAWYDRLVMRAAQDLVSPRQLAWTARLDRELPNLRSALELSVKQQGSAVTTRRMAGSLFMFWISRGLLSEGRYWLTKALAADESADDEPTMQALYSLATLAGFQGDLEVVERAAQTMHKIAPVPDEATARAFAATLDGILALFTGELATAVDQLERAVQGHHEAGNVACEIELLIALVLAFGWAGEGDRAVACQEQVVSITRQRGETWYEAYSLWALGVANWRQGHPAEARQNLEQSLRLRRSMNDLLGSAWCLEGLSFVAETEQKHERAAVLLGVSASVSTQAGTPAGPFPDITSAFQDAEGLTRKILGDAAFNKFFAYGAGLGIDRAIAYALGETLETTVEDTTAWSILTPRQRQVASLVAEGRTNKQIADTLVISERTAETHVEHILTKLGFNSRTQIAAWVTQFQ